jgi:hypothetical protein
LEREFEAVIGVVVARRVAPGDVGLGADDVADDVGRARAGALDQEVELRALRGVLEDDGGRAAVLDGAVVDEVGPGRVVAARIEIDGFGIDAVAGAAEFGDEVGAERDVDRRGRHGGFALPARTVRRDPKSIVSKAKGKSGEIIPGFA